MGNPEESAKAKKEKILEILEEYELQFALARQELETAKRQARDAKNNLDQRENEHSEKVEQLERHYQNEVERLTLLIKGLRETIEAMGGETEIPPTYPAFFLWLGEKILYTPPASEENPEPATVELQEAWVRVYGKIQTVIVSPRIKLEELKRGVKVVVRENESGRYATLVKIDDNQEPSGGESIQPIKKIEDSNIAIIDVGNGHKYFTIREGCGELEAGDMVVIDNESNIVICKAPQLEEEVDRKKIDPVMYKDVGGLKEQIQAIYDVVFLPEKKPELFKRLGIRSPNSLLLEGPPGTGKTLLARATANEGDMLFFAFSGASFRSAYPGEDARRIELLFREAAKAAKKTGRRVIIFIDEAESLFPDRSKLHEGDHGLKDLVNCVLHCMQGLEGRTNVVVMAATNQREAMDDAAIRRFDKIITIPVPSRDGRQEIIAIHTKEMTLDPDVNLEEIVEKTHGYTGSDIERLCMDTALKTYHRCKDTLADDEIPTVKRVDFIEILKHMRPAGTRNLVITDTGVTFKDVAGLRDAKFKLLREVNLLLGNVGKLAKRLGMKPRKGIFLVSPPGWGKTLLAKALANECGLNFIPVKGTDVRVCWVGESARNLKTFFEIAKRHAPALLFLDEIDSMLPLRGTGAGGVRVDEQMVASFNEEMDGIVSLENVIVLAATNRLDLVDPAVVRRLTGGAEPIWLSLLEHDERIECFQIYTKNAPLADDVDFNCLAELTGPRRKAIPYHDKIIIAIYTFNGNEIRGICEEALRLAAEEFLKKFGGDEEKADEHADECFTHQRHFLEVIALKLDEDTKELEAARERLKANEATEVADPDKDFSALAHAADEFNLGDDKSGKAGPHEEESEF